MRKFRINLFALPSQTAILFWLITAVLLGAMLIGLSGTHLIPMWPLAIALLLLPIREFFMRPDRDIRQYRLEIASQRFPFIQESIRRRAEHIGLKRVPQLLISNSRDETYEMGSYRHWYIIMGLEKAQTLEDFLIDPRKSNLADVQILHELYHFKTGDYWQLGYLTELFKASFNLMLWALFFLVGWGIVLILAKDAFFQFSPYSLLYDLPSNIRTSLDQFLPAIFPSAAEMEILRIKAQGINLFYVLTFIANVTVPYILLTGILWLFYRPLLWRMREFYADAGVVQTQGGTSYFWDFVFEFTQTSADKITPEVRKNIVQKILNYIRKIWQGDFWPSFSQRLDAIEMPEHVFYSWKQIAWLLGILVLLLETFLATPIALPLTGKNPMSFTTLVIIVSLVYFLLPHLVLGKSAWKDGFRILFIVFLIRTAWLLVTLGLMWGLYFIQPEMLRGSLQSAIMSIARYAGNDPVGINLFDFLIKASILNLLQIPIIFVIQIISVSGLLFLFKRVLQWYSFISDNRRFRLIIFSLTIGVSFVLLTLVMPMSMAVLNGDFSIFKDISGVFALLGALALVSGGRWFLVRDQRHYQKCPSCKFDTSQLGLFGTNCVSCGSTLHPWLWTEYEE